MRPARKASFRHREAPSAFSYCECSVPSKAECEYGQAILKTTKARCSNPNRRSPAELPLLRNTRRREICIADHRSVTPIHAELCATLRVAGRQILRFEQPGDESLEKVREVLKRAENIRKVLETRGALPEITAEVASELITEPAMTDPPMRKPAPNKPHLNRPVSLRLVPFPKKG